MSRTRASVPFPEGISAAPFLGSHGRREETAKNRRPPDPVHLTVGRRAAVQPPACLMASGPQPPGEVGADAHSLIKLRERTENPQVTDVPRDLRVHGARHASRESLPPSKPNRPHIKVDTTSDLLIPRRGGPGHEMRELRLAGRDVLPFRKTDAPDSSACRGSTRSRSIQASVFNQMRQSHCSATPRRSQSMAFSVAQPESAPTPPCAHV